MTRPLLLSTRRTHRSCPSFNRTLRLTSTSAASAAAAPKGSKHYSLGRGPTELRPSTRKDTEMAKSAAKPGSIPSYEEELEKLSAELKAAEEQRKIRALETDIEHLKLRIRKAKKMLRLLEGRTSEAKRGEG